MDVAQRLGISQALVSKYEKGELLLHAELLARFATLLHTSADELLGLGRRRPALASAPPTPVVDRGLARRFALIQSLPRRDRDALTRTIDAFLVARHGGRAA